MNQILMLVVSLILAPSPAQAAWLKLSLSPQVEVDGPRVFLGDIAKCEAVLESQCRHLASIDLGAAAGAGDNLTLARQDIAAILAVEYPGKDLALDGSKFVRIKTRSQPPDMIKIQTYIQEFFRNNFKESDLKISLEQMVLMNSNQALPVGNGSYRAVDLEANADKNMDWILEKILKPRHLVLEYIDEKSGKTYPFSIRIKAKIQKQVPVAARNLNRGTRLGSADVTTTWVDVEQTNRNVKKVEEVIGHDVKRSIRVGQAFLPDHLSEPQAVKRGQKIKVRFDTGGLVITGDAKALRDAKINEVVELEMLITKKKINAAIVSSDLAVVRRL